MPKGVVKGEKNLGKMGNKGKALRRAVGGRVKNKADIGKKTGRKKLI